MAENFLQNLLDDKEFYDITIEVGKDPYIKIFRAHMVILYYRSSYLQRIISTNKKKNNGTLMPIKLSNFSPEIFQIILRYIYVSGISLEECNTSEIFKILDAAGELSLQELVAYLQSFLIENKANWMEENFNFVYQTSFENNSFLELQKYCTDLISKKPAKIFKSPNYFSILENLLISLIQNDYL
ncbi:BTB/POZ protein [Rhizophagus clarus]|uniref:BTB/POZ protein n=1 Tax=Rhizophagus clarus TaxID=94130 RepID=A0A8H3QUU7_9GLOM|nr:BTB/POZ protein [Rhizophagus clarus]